MRTCHPVPPVRSGSPRGRIALVLACLALLFTAPGQADQTLRCTSQDYKRQYCAIETGDNVTLVRQHSKTDCREGRNWGYDRRGIWVDDGCDAEFRVAGRRGHWRDDDGLILRCTSENYQRRDCQVRTGNRVTLVRQYSKTDCREGRNWGYDRRGVWVDGGCDAEFQVGGRDDDRPSESKVVRCTSDDFKHRYCRTYTGNRVTLVRQYSKTDCREGRNWGYDRQGIWVDDGCDADFRVGGPSAYGGGDYAGELVRCTSSDYAHQRCRVRTDGGVTLVKQHSDTACREGRNWGYDRHGIWVDGGCDADFRIGAARRDAY